MNSFKTLCQYGYSLLGEKPPLIDNSMEYFIVGESIYFPHCVIISPKDSCLSNEKTMDSAKKVVYISSYLIR